MICLNVQVTPDLKSRLEVLQQKTHGCSKAEVFRKGVLLLETLILAQERGAKLIIRQPDNTEETLLLH